jgi:hypothetical protein
MRKAPARGRRVNIVLVLSEAELEDYGQRLVDRFMLEESASPGMME